MEDPNAQQNQITRLTLDLRGSRFTIEQEMLMNLPESVLLCLFPNGLVLSRQPGPGYGGGAEGGEDGNGDTEDDEEEVYMVDVSTLCESEVVIAYLHLSYYCCAVSVRSSLPFLCLVLLQVGTGRLLWLARSALSEGSPCSIKQRSTLQ